MISGASGSTAFFLQPYEARRSRFVIAQICTTKRGAGGNAMVRVRLSGCTGSVLRRLRSLGLMVQRWE